MITQVIIENPPGDWPENYVINLDNHQQLNITAKAQKQDGSYLCNVTQEIFESASTKTTFFQIITCVIILKQLFALGSGNIIE